MKKLSLFVLTLFGLLMSSNASNETYSRCLRGSDIHYNAQLAINAQQYDRFNWNVSNPFVRVRLYLAEDRYVVHSNNENILVTYDITLTGNNIPSITLTDTLNIGYRQNSPYRDLDINEYQNYKAASLKITSDLPNIAEDIVFELQLCYPRFTKTGSVGTPFDLRRKYFESTNELLLTWGYLDGADEYDLEWLFIDNPTFSNNVKYDFANATRITTSNNFYKIPLAYPKGNILCRVRGRGSYYANGEFYPVFGPWSFVTSSGNVIPDSNHICRYDFAGLEDSLTWQYTAVYAEEGKRKEVITFYDGTLRNRQEVTVLNTDSIAVVGETFYDHIGRQALQALPTPTPSRGIRYYGTNSTAVGQFNGYFPKSQYDYDVTIAHNLMFPANAGSALYYSSNNNPFANHPHWPNVNQTPWDSGYTYTHVRYLNDGTDRVHSQSAVGSTFKMGGGRETRYFYGNPSQAELDRLFGNEVGDASHYQKVLAVDANGEVSVSYYDMKERLIASAIVPSADTSLLAVDSTPPVHNLHSTIFFDDSSRQYVQNIAVGMPTYYNFTYFVSPSEGLRDTCSGTVGCIDCRYLLIFSLWNTENMQYVFKDSLVVSERDTIIHDTILLPGNYQLYKNITMVNDDMTAYGFELFANRQRPCVHYDTAEVCPCYTPCEEYAMKVADIKKPDPTNPTYVQTLAECENPPQSFNTECEAKRAAMLADMSPGGQYFDNIRTCCPNDTNCYCETNPNSFLDSICAWRFMEDSVFFHNIMSDAGCVTYKDTLWDYMRDHWIEEYAEVMLKYHPEYHLYQALCDCGDAEAQHYFDSVFMNTYTYESALELGLLNPLGMDVNTDIEIQNSNETGFQPFNAAMVDPFFKEETACCQENFDKMYISMVERLFSYFSWEGHCTSIWWLLFDPAKIANGQRIKYSDEIEKIMVDFQKNIVDQWAENYHCSDSDARWLLFKSIYTYLKDEIRRTVLPGCMLSCSIGDGDTMHDICCHKPEFYWGQSGLWSDYFDVGTNNCCDYYLSANDDCPACPLTAGRCFGQQGGFQIRFLCNPVHGITPENLMNSSATALNSLYENCREDCEAYANSWMSELRDYFANFCEDVLLDTLTWKNLRNDLIAICTESCQESLDYQNFYAHQRLDSVALRGLLTQYCRHFSENYPPIVYPRVNNQYSDCGCENYHQYLNSYALTFWSDPRDIVESLVLGGITASTSEVSKWNGFCIKTRYSNMLHGIDDTTALYGLHFPEQFRCYPDLPDSVLCHQQAILAAAAQDTISFYHALDSLVAEHRAIYASHCMRNLQESLTIIDSSTEFLYTLYYYDQADNLIKTVPPEGVHVIDNQTTLDAVAAYRNHVARYDTLQPGFVRPNHTMVTNYRYNTLNQVIQSYQPDYDNVSYVYYDILSRPILSQDGKQKPQHKYSYTDYDSLGRIKEVGQVTNSTPFSRNDADTLNFITEFLNGGVKSEITKTWYDEPMSLSLNLNQTHLRNRIAAVSFAPADDNNYQSATHYSYDIHGNVKRLVQDIPALATYDRQFTMLDYEYDLISGNVNRVWYQKGALEQFSHRYRYDADNRVTHVYTSNIFKVKRDSAVFQERLEARYFYLPTGALSRTELGHKQIQGIDYAYTLQGWLKDINGYRSSGLDMYDSYDSYDIGNDGVIQTGNVNRLFAHDCYASSIQYYQGDYTPVSGNNYFNELSYGAIPLYNGNISALSESIYNLYDRGLLKLFRYDKLNRIKQMRTAAHQDNNSGWESASDNFATDYSYDWNGNLLFLQRKNQSGQVMHSIRYTYPNGNNRLGAITSTGIASSVYQYDALGNLVRDNAEGLTVGWNAMGKVDTIHRNGSLLSSFRYSPTGQRQVKTDSSGTTFYIHDATGNVMCVYRLKNDTLTASERYIYGSKRLGMLEQQIWITANSIGLQDSNTIGVRVYEFTDHLGNVTYTAQDRKWLVLDSYGQLQFIPATVNYTDYYPFGYPMWERSYYNGGYRYFFNGQETDNEVLGEGALHAFEYRMHDTRVGRFWSVDPLAGKFPWNSVYAFAENSPVGFLELEGLEKVRFGADVVDFTDKNEIQVRNYLKKYYDYHRGKITEREILSSSNDDEYWEVYKMTNVYMRRTGVRIMKYSSTGVSCDVRRTVYQWMTHIDGCVDRGYDGANQGTITTKDWVVAFGFLGSITGIATIAEAGASIDIIIGLVNNIDDAFGVFTNGSGSMSQDLTPEDAKLVTSSVKTILSVITSFKGHYNLKKKGTKKETETKKALDYLNSVLDSIDMLFNTSNTVKDIKDAGKEETK